MAKFAAGLNDTGVGDASKFECKGGGGATLGTSRS